MKGTPVPPTDLEAVKRQQRAFYQANAKYYHLIDEQFQSGYTYDDIPREPVGGLRAPVHFLDVGCGIGYCVRRAVKLGRVATGTDLSLPSRNRESDVGRGSPERPLLGQQLPPVELAECGNAGGARELSPPTPASPDASVHR
jgi:hypothetical protein